MTPLDYFRSLRDQTPETVMISGVWSLVAGVGFEPTGEVLSLLDNETGMHSCLEPKTQASPVGAGGKRRHPRALENTGIGADEPEA